jgi:hypothetical protein
MQEVAKRNGLVGFGTGDRKGSLYDRQIPNSRVVRVALGTGYNRVEGNRRASRNGRVSSSLPPKSLPLPFATFFPCCRGDSSNGWSCEICALRLFNSLALSRPPPAVGCHGVQAAQLPTLAINTPAHRASLVAPFLLVGGAVRGQAGGGAHCPLITKPAEQGYLAPPEHGAGSSCRSLYALALMFPPQLSSHTHTPVVVQPRDVPLEVAQQNRRRRLRDAQHGHHRGHHLLLPLHDLSLGHYLTEVRPPARVEAVRRERRGPRVQRDVRGVARCHRRANESVRAHVYRPEQALSSPPSILRDVQLCLVGYGRVRGHP